MKKLVIAIDFDGIIVNNKYPGIGKLRRNAKKYINKIYEDGHWIIINTCRSGEDEKAVIQFLNENGIPYHEVNRNLQHRIEFFRNDCRKIGADIYIDDKNLDFYHCSWGQIYTKIESYANRRKVIICIVGESGTGKTTIAKYIEEEFDIPMIQSYTDRPKRYTFEDGHVFLTKEMYDQIKVENMIAHTTFGNHRYCCVKSDVKDCNTYVIDEDGIAYLKKNFGDEYNIITLRISRTNRNVSNARKERDVGKFNNNNTFDYYIRNDYECLDELYDMIDYKMSYIKQEFDKPHIVR